MNKIDMTFRYASSTVYVIVAGLLFFYGEVASGILVSGLLYWTIAATLSDVKLAETRADLELALKREHEHIKRYSKAEAEVAYHEYLRRNRRDKIVAEINEEYRMKSREAHSRSVENTAGDAE